jgi:hypothetical protein
MSSKWKITIPVLRAEERADGMHLIGEASGPEKDTHGTSMEPEAIVDFARQIADRVAAGNPIPYIDAHAKDGVLRQLGDVMEGFIKPNFHLGVDVLLDSINPAATSLYRQISERGKQFGMSIAGDGEYKIVERNGEKHPSFMQVILREIANTTRPSWVPSFGSVLARSIDGETGVQEMGDTIVKTAAPEQGTATSEVTTTGSATVALSETAGETTKEVVVEAGTASADVERAKIAAKDRDAIVSTFKTLMDQLDNLGITVSGAEAAIAKAAPETTNVENSDTGTTEVKGTDLVAVGNIKVERSVVETVANIVAEKYTTAITGAKDVIERQAEYIKKLEDLPAGKIPEAVVRDKFEDTFAAKLERMSPEEKMELALTVAHAEVGVRI